MTVEGRVVSVRRAPSPIRGARTSGWPFDYGNGVMVWVKRPRDPEAVEMEPEALRKRRVRVHGEPSERDARSAMVVSSAAR
jgi:hypothetical protein